jgi:uncharacterized membrane protein
MMFRKSVAVFLFLAVCLTYLTDASEYISAFSTDQVTQVSQDVIDEGKEAVITLYIVFICCILGIFFLVLLTFLKKFHEDMRDDIPLFHSNS